ncbi:phospholipase A1-IIbeta-like [Durio zibethinus]|uniref:Phospholipase A1 n=1 Tax=Durio zibethinus TaxID=66656 RepID=A0A6P6BJM3_DURZI|nr:phospholipase A1-IIbeta-like [Durio zibethinus]
MASSIASSWRELSGEKCWKDLLHPLDLDLRRYIIHYLQRAGAAGDPFNGNKASKGYGLSLYPPDEFFARDGLGIANPYRYQVTNFIYAATSTNESEWFGYVAVATDDGKAALGRRDILVSWRGTITNVDWADDAKFFPTSAKELFKTDLAQVHSGFLSIYTGTVDSPYSTTSAKEQVRSAVKEQVDKYQNEDVSITVVGHSLGAALATLNAMDIVFNGFNTPTDSDKAFMVTAFTAASPRVGNEFFRGVFDFDELKHLRLLRIVNTTDPIPKVPWLHGFYVHVGEKLEIDTTKSTYLKSNANPHNLDVYAHGVAGVQENGEFKLEEELDFDNAVVNKHGDCLLDESKIPIEWWNNEKFKGMVQMDNGHWKFVDSAYVPEPPNA